MIKKLRVLSFIGLASSLLGIVFSILDKDIGAGILSGVGFGGNITFMITILWRKE